VTGSSDLPAIRRAASRGFVFATFLQPHVKVKQLFEAYRSAYVLNGQPGGGGTAFMPLVYVADTESEAEAGMKELIWYMTAKTEAQYRNPPGYAPVEANVMGLKGAFAGRTDAMRSQGLEFQREQGVVMYGTPDQVVAQVKRFYDNVGGFDHLLMMMQAGFLDHARTVANIRLFAKECYPAIRDLARTKPLASKAAAE
jgi:alkanesulfonate monooxygenase SsuD/methylene tetrahydromethanopterin reductase-like flavin-dependent oxidoreductase (luciferase family)